ncbi:dCTP deaminase domain-containing protein [Donghicola tyrosinivorans]|uniref:Deoxycytidine triphosphate deaminase n=1 Tax=Donghicola tyrosinivorans TaxID=1652492 RepID=A0A2T0WYF6_9RHOB|nr:hypothetical protein [Donghicola tyrosinivorans]PRY91728.1 deoxycytidine triphosphate deaminase [Donghicola tyrosinivorans]
MNALSAEDLKRENGKTFLVHPVCSENFTPLGYDLRVGKAFILSQSTSPQEISYTVLAERDGEKFFCFPPNSTIIIVTKERVWLSGFLMGAIHARGSLALRGIMINSTTVDPNWDGHMLMRVHNTSQKVEELSENEAFCTLVLHRLTSYTKGKPKSDPRSAVNKLDDIYGTTVAPELYKELQQPNSKKDFEATSERINKANLEITRSWKWNFFFRTCLLIFSAFAIFAITFSVDMSFLISLFNANIRNTIASALLLLFLLPALYFSAKLFISKQ